MGARLLQFVAAFVAAITLISAQRTVFRGSPAAATSAAVMLGGTESHKTSTVFTELLEQSGIAAELHGDGPFTLLAPSDWIFSLRTWSLEQLRDDPVELRRFVLLHIVKGTPFSSNWHSDAPLPLESLLPGANLSLKVAKRQFDTLAQIFSDNYWQTYAALVPDSDAKFADGAVVVIDGFIEPAPKLDKWLALVRESGVLAEVEGKTFTLLAPVDEKVNAEELRRDKAKLERMVRLHMVPNQRMPDHFHRFDELTFTSLLDGLKLILSNGGISIGERWKIQTSPISGSSHKLETVRGDGFIVAIRNPLSPPPPPEMSFTVFAQLLQESGVAAKLATEYKHKAPFTILAPSDYNFNLRSYSLERLHADPVKLRQFVLLHIFTGVAPSSTWQDDEPLKLHSLRPEAELSVKFVQRPTDSTAKAFIFDQDYWNTGATLVRGSDARLDDITVVVIDEFLNLSPATGVWTTLVHESGVLDELTGKFTLLAPVDSALTADLIDELRADRAKLQRLVRLHIVPDVQLADKHSSYLPTSYGSLLPGTKLTVSFGPLNWASVSVGERINIQAQMFPKSRLAMKARSASGVKIALTSVLSLPSDANLSSAQGGDLVSENQRQMLLA